MQPQFYIFNFDVLDEGHPWLIGHGGHPYFIGHKGHSYFIGHGLVLLYPCGVLDSAFGL